MFVFFRWPPSNLFKLLNLCIEAWANHWILAGFIEVVSYQKLLLMEEIRLTS